ncbi:hypothetical protein D6810_00540 [Candidatus Dojkabacteria bacterium]|uniref:Chitin-binding type-2 domain-containing protein n=1 Tax=Candidatus Dojkabacteria bacterium TaxID=2099670 RepID=A0A3M0Z1Q0_9BACT|nr:MAG: hypothetical protein D6810_00540 [Candidatus Dojkabacteria bacterium]
MEKVSKKNTKVLLMSCLLVSIYILISISFPAKVKSCDWFVKRNNEEHCNTEQNKMYRCENFKGPGTGNWVDTGRSCGSGGGGAGSSRSSSSNSNNNNSSSNTGNNQSRSAGSNNVNTGGQISQNSRNCADDPRTAVYCRNQPEGKNVGGCVCVITQGNLCACIVGGQAGSNNNNKNNTNSNNSGSNRISTSTGATADKKCRDSNNGIFYLDSGAVIGRGLGPGDQGRLDSTNGTRYYCSRKNNCNTLIPCPNNDCALIAENDSKDQNCPSIKGDTSSCSSGQRRTTGTYNEILEICNNGVWVFNGCNTGFEPSIRNGSNICVKTRSGTGGVSLLNEVGSRVIKQVNQAINQSNSFFCNGKRDGTYTQNLSNSPMEILYSCSNGKVSVINVGCPPGYYYDRESRMCKAISYTHNDTQTTSSYWAQSTECRYPYQMIINQSSGYGELARCVPQKGEGQFEIVSLKSATGNLYCPRGYLPTLYDNNRIRCSCIPGASMITDRGTYATCNDKSEVYVENGCAAGYVYNNHTQTCVKANTQNESVALQSYSQCNQNQLGQRVEINNRVHTCQYDDGEQSQPVFVPQFCAPGYILSQDQDETGCEPFDVFALPELNIRQNNSGFIDPMRTNATTIEFDGSKRINAMKKNLNNSIRVEHDKVLSSLLFKTAYAQEAPPRPELIDINALNRGEYIIKLQGFEDANVIVEDDVVKLLFYVDVNSNGVQDPDEPLFDLDGLEFQVSKVKSYEKIGLKSGWNLVGFPLFGTDVKKASDLVKLINSSGGRATQISKYDNGNWIHFVDANLTNGESIQFGADFNLIPGQSYFVYSQIDSDFILKGNEYLENPPLNIQKGWNMVGFPGPLVLTSNSFLQRCSALLPECKAISRYVNGNFDTVYYEDNIFFGNEFLIDKTSGYFVLNKGERKVIKL